MSFEHLTHPRLLSERVSVALAGCGGSGSLMLTGLARLDAALRALGHEGLHVAAYDPDTVSVANVGRQMFAPADVGANKAAVLVNRLNAWYGLRWQAVPQRFDAQLESDLVISCVDTAAARVQIGAIAARMHAIYWLDLGNRADDGQVVLGIPPQDKVHEAFTCRLPTVLELFPELRAKKFKGDDAAPSCSLAQALERQHLFVNQAVATVALQLLWQIFRFGKTSWHGAFVNLATGRTAPLPVDPKAWARFGHHAEPAEEFVYARDTRIRMKVGDEAERRLLEQWCDERND